jgi:HAD superfamily hydrolase (TIGR01549 family)
MFVHIILTWCLKKESTIVRPNIIKYKVILIDVGNVIFHDIPVDIAFGHFVFRELQKHININTTLFWSLYTLQLSNGNENWAENLCNQFCKEKTQKIIASSWERVLKIWMDITVPIDGAINKIKELSKIKLLVIAANQPEETMRTLEFYGIKNCFADIFLDAMIGLSKPNLDFYKFILNKIGFMPNEVLMVGDRIDNDIKPSNMLGIHSAWINYKPTKINIKHIPKEWQEEYYKNITFHRVGNNFEAHLNSNDATKARYIANSLYELFDFIGSDLYS